MNEKIFISYSRKDKDIVFPIRDEIQNKLHINCWIDLNGIESDQQFEDVIISAINRTELFLFMYSANSANSKWTRDELRFAELKKKRIVILSIDGSPLDDWFSFKYGGHDIIDYSVKEQSEKLMRNLEEWFGKELSNDVIVPTTTIHGLKIKPNKECEVFIDEELIGVAKANVVTRFPLEQGEYTIACVSVDNGQRIELKDVQINNCDILRKPVFEKDVDSAIKDEVPIEKTNVRVTKEMNHTINEEVMQIKSEDSNERNLKVTENGRSEILFELGELRFKMILVKGGELWIGAHRQRTGLFNLKPNHTIPNFDSDCLSDESPVHKICLKDFYICETQVTVAQWNAVMEQKNIGKRGMFPIEQVSWFDCSKFIAKLNELYSSQLKGKMFSLPWENEWEYAARGGQKSNGFKYSGSSNIDDVAWYRNNSGGPHYVGKKHPNELGIYDMSGNVSEWCLDAYKKYTLKESQSKLPEIINSSKISCIFRGGSYLSETKHCRVSFRGHCTPKSRNLGLGFRLVLRPIQP